MFYRSINFFIGCLPLLIFLILVVLSLRFLILNLLRLLILLFFPCRTYLLPFLSVCLGVLEKFFLLRGLQYAFNALRFILNFIFHLVSFLNFFLFINQMLTSLKFFLFFMKLVILLMESYCFSLINLQLILIKLRFFITFYSKHYFNQ